MIILYDFSALHNALVVGTGNKTELIIGYFTLHGDGACALEPIGHLYKTQVRQLAEYLNIPRNIIDKPPSAGLWYGQTDEEELGMTYKDIDAILYQMYDARPKIETIESVLTLKAKIVWKMIKKNSFKNEVVKKLI